MRKLSELNFLIVDSVMSTNRVMAEEMAEAPHGTVLMARSQTAGRGQRGNSWEAASGMNVTMSLMLRPERIDVRSQWRMSQAVALGAVAHLDRLLGSVAADVSLKWPNDIYVGDRKIGGILIENSLDGIKLRRAIVGIGLNLNQRKFVSDAPNPVSAAMLTGLEYDVVSVARGLAASMLAEFDRADGAVDFGWLDCEYAARLWHREGMHPYIDAATGERFVATIARVEPDGHLALCLADGSERSYAFKEVVQPVEPAFDETSRDRSL